MRHYLLRKNTDLALPVLCSQSRVSAGKGRRGRREVIRMFKHILVSKGWWRWPDKIIKYFRKILEGPCQSVCHSWCYWVPYGPRGCHKHIRCVQRATVTGLQVKTSKKQKTNSRNILNFEQKKLIVFWFRVLNVSLRFNRGSNYVQHFVHIGPIRLNYIPVLTS